MIDLFKRWFSHSKEQDIDDSQNPWAGLASYEDPEIAERKLKFCGRDDDSYDLARLIMGNVFVTLYGKSGIGKTSLLNAGVFPELREEQYTPVSIRLGMRDDEHPQSYQTMIVDAVERVVKRTETINAIDEQPDQQSIDYLWNYFARHRFYDKYDELTTPVIVFDQFEEVFRGHRDEAETLLRQLDYLNDKDHTLDSCEVDGQPYRYEQNYRFVVSIREDDLYRLEDSIDNCYLPALKRCRYRLRSLSEGGARDAILIPGEGLYKLNEKDFIAEAIISKSRNDDGSISTNIISLLCSRIYVEYKKTGSEHISPALVENFIKGNPFERFYNEATRSFSNKEKSYIEDNFVDSTSRRNSIPESDFLLHVKNGTKLLEGKNRILQCISTSSNGKNNRVELIHDSFCEPLIVLKKRREKRKRLQWIISTVAIILVCLCVIAYIFYLFNENQSKGDVISVQEKQLLHERDSIQKTSERLQQALLRLQSAIMQKDSVNEQLILSYEQMTDREKRLYIANQKLLEREKDLSVANHGFQTNLSRVLAEKANQLVDEGDSYLARLIALEALPPNLPYTPEAESALRKALKSNSAILRGHNSDVYTASFSPNGHYIVSAGANGLAIIWDSDTGKELFSLGNDENTYMDKLMMDAAFSPDNNCVATVSTDGNVVIWDFLKGKLSQYFQFPDDGRWLRSVCFSPDGKKLMAANDNLVVLWNIATMDILFKKNYNCKSTNFLKPIFNKQGDKILIASGNTISIFSVLSGELYKEIICDNDIDEIFFSPNDTSIITLSYTSTNPVAVLSIWDINNGKRLLSRNISNVPIVSCSLHPNGEFVAATCADRRIRVWNIEDCSQIYISQEYNVALGSIEFNSLGTELVFTTENDFTVRKANLNRIQSPQLIGNHNAVNYVSFSPDGQLIATASGDMGFLKIHGGETIIKIWDFKKKSLLRTFEEHHKDMIEMVTFSPDGKKILSASHDHTAILWDVYYGQPIHIFNKHNNWVKSALFSHNGKYIITSSGEDVQIWDALSFESIVKMSVNDFLMYASFSNDDKFILLALRDHASILVIDWKENKIIHELKGHTDSPTCAIFSPNDDFIVSTSQDHSIIIWDSKTGKIVQKLLGHNDYVLSVSFSKDGEKLVTAAGDGTIRIWDLKSGIPLMIYENEDKYVQMAEFSKEGGNIVSVSWDGMIKMWNFPHINNLIEKTKERFKNRQLTPEERRKYYLE